ncbi:ubiquitin carboxyl-terminal hydrolase 15-like isoform X1 [Styela clava]
MDTNGSINEKDIFEEFGQPLEVGDSWYLISVSWVNNWKNHAGIDDSSGENPGQIDNSRLFEENSDTLREHLLEESEYMLIPAECWKKLVHIYGIPEGQKPICRKVIETGTFSKQTTVEIYPPCISMKQHDGDGQITKENFSRVALIGDIHKRMKEIFGIPVEQTTRLYIEDSSENSLDDKFSMEKAGVGPTSVVVIEKQNDNKTWPRSTIAPPSYTEATTSTSSTLSKYNTKNSNSSSFSSSNGSHNTRYSSNNTYRSYRDTPGICGLSNLGNTCFMNSAIQCLSNVSPLTMYFYENKYIKELNRTNPIGMRGKLAETYATLIHDIWSGNHSSVSPREFKYKVSSFAPQFSGYQQHDSQELMAFLIDGLHEDLNRIDNKPYVELKDSAGRPDYDVAIEAWKNHLRRNDSIIVDMFHGLFKSTIVCPDCDRVSVTFDPFGYLPLPLPKAKDRMIPCTFFPRDAKKPVTKYNVTVSKDGCIRDLCKALAKQTETEENELIVTDVYNYRFYKIYRGSESIGNYTDRDNLFVFQIGFDEEVENDANEQEEEEKLEYARVVMRQCSSAHGMRLFAHPFLIPVKSGVTTYRKLYNSILAAVSRYVKQEYKENIKMLSELKRCELNESIGSDVDGNEVGDTNKEQDEMEDETQWFKLVTINSFGTTVYKELKDNDEPIKFTGDVYFSAEWDSATCEEYAEENWSDTFKNDESMNKTGNKDKGINLQKCMEFFTTPEKLGKEDLWYCPKCKDHKQATKKFDLWTLPPVLIIHLKRFSYTRWSRDKIGTYVDFPTRDLDLSDFIINPAKSKWHEQKKRYNLIGVSNHYGGMGGGHYTAYCRNYKDGKWYYFDDSSVTESSEDKVKTKAAYMLMYQRQDIEEWVNKEGDDDFNFLESMVSPRSCHVRGFDFNMSEKKREQLLNGNDSNLSNCGEEEMDTS